MLYMQGRISKVNYVVMFHSLCFCVSAIYLRNIFRINWQ
jgi:hypothetical protein